jgi:hypothetical protein
MKLKVFAIYDEKAEAYLAPFNYSTRGQAIRAFTEIASDPNTQINKHLLDFTLYEVGTFDNEKGHYINCSENINLGRASEFVQIGLENEECLKIHKDKTQDQCIDLINH